MSNKSIFKGLEYSLGAVSIVFLKKVIYGLWVMGIVFLSIVLLESVSFFFNKREASFLYQSKNIDRVLNENIALRYDPLLGWERDFSNERNVTVKNDCIYLENYSNPKDDTLTIYISGGSASDILYQRYNWPVKLFEKLKQNNLNCQIFVAAVAGYGTSQELLKFLQSGMDIKDIDYHISYFGVNEDMEHNSIVTPYEVSVINKLTQPFNSSFMPNFMSLLRKFLKPNNTNYTVKRSQQNQTLKNLTIFQAIAQNKGYHFIPILQPAWGGGKYSNVSAVEQFFDSVKTDNSEEMFLLLRSKYENFHSVKRSAYFIDFTYIFDSINDYPFLDHCHVKEEYQYLISDRVFDLIEESGRLRGINSH